MVMAHACKRYGYACVVVQAQTSCSAFSKYRWNSECQSALNFDYSCAYQSSPYCPWVDYCRDRSRYQHRLCDLKKVRCCTWRSQISQGALRAPAPPLRSRRHRVYRRPRRSTWHRYRTTPALTPAARQHEQYQRPEHRVCHIPIGLERIRRRTVDPVQKLVEHRESGN